MNAADADAVDVAKIAAAKPVDPLTEAYRYLQGVVGVIALVLPPVVALGDRIIDGHGLRGSISSYYYGRTGGWFVGTLCALGVFFFSYDYRPKGNGQRADNRLSNVASIAAIGVALFPTSSEGSKAHGGSLVVSRVHLGCAGLLFACLAVFSLYHFTRYDDLTPADAEKQKNLRWRRIYRNPAVVVPGGSRKPLRNLIHRLCGLLIIAGMLLVLADNVWHWGLVFFWESLAVWAFGISWLVKSHWLQPLADQTGKK